MITIAIIDKHPILRTGLSIFLKDLISDIRILETDSINTFQQSCPDTSPDLIILGNTINSGTKELDSVYNLKKAYGIETVIVLSDSNDKNTIIHYLKAGVKGFILKEATITELTACVTHVLNGKRYLCNEAVEVLIENYASIIAKQRRQSSQ